MRRFFLLFLAIPVLTTACGGSGSPTSPSGTTGGATINGAFVTPAGSAATSSLSGNPAAAGVGIAGLVVTVAGTNLSAPVDSSNRFALRNVPNGDAQLLFSAPGFSASLAVPSVQSSETISLNVSVAGSSVVLESQSRSMGSEVQLEGRVESLPPTIPAGSLVVAGQSVTTNVGTKFYGSTTGTFADLAIGIRVHVKGQTSGSSLVASAIQIQNTNADIPVEINGIVKNFSSSLPNFQLEIDGRLIRGDATTEFFGNSQLSDLANDRRAEVKGLQRDGYVLATRIHVNLPDDDDDEQNQSASIEGTLMSKNGAGSTLTLVVGTTTVKTSSSTEVQRKGDVQDLSVLALGMTLHVVGDRQSDGSINARKIQIKDDAVGGLFEMEGSAGGVKGTCPTLTFGVNGYDIVTDAATTFTPACSQLKSGNKVKVKGLVQSGGTVKATSVVKP